MPEIPNRMGWEFSFVYGGIEPARAWASSGRPRVEGGVADPPRPADAQRLLIPLSSTKIPEFPNHFGWDFSFSAVFFTGCFVLCGQADIALFCKWVN
jgi:hypothetical protein